MMALEPAQQSGSVMHAAGLRTVVAVGLLAFGVGDLAAIHVVLLPRYLASRSHQAEALSPTSTIRERATPTPVVAPRLPVPVANQPTEPTAPAAVVDSPVPVPEAAALAAAVPERAEARGATNPTDDSRWPPLLFVPNTAWLSPESRATLTRLADRLKGEPSLPVVLAGHTDDMGSPQLNRALSLLRATRARAWLVQRGVAPDQIEVRGFGASRPAASGRSREARAQNRRVEISLGERSP